MNSAGTRNAGRTKIIGTDTRRQRWGDGTNLLARRYGRIPARNLLLTILAMLFQSFQPMSERFPRLDLDTMGINVNK